MADDGVNGGPTGLSALRRVVGPDVEAMLRNGFILLLLVVCLGYIVHLITTYNDLIYDPSNVRIQIKVTLRDGLGFTWDSLMKPFAALNPALIAMRESRPRYLMYCLLFFDQKIHLQLYSLLPPHPSASTLWPFTLIGTPWLLYRFLSRSGHRRAASIALVLYLSSVGFLSNVTLNYHPGQPFGNFLLLLLMNLTLDAEKDGVGGKLLFEIGGMRVILICVLLFCALLTDEDVYVAYVLLPVLFPDVFVARGLHGGVLRRMTVNLGIYALPGIALLFVTLVVYPYVTARFEGYEFNALATIVPTTFHYAVPLPVTPSEALPFTVKLISRTFSSLVGTSIAPWQISPWIPFHAVGNFFEQRNNLPKRAAVAVLIGATIVAVWRGAPQIRRTLLHLLRAYGVFLLWHSFVHTYHIGVTNGYFYGSMHAVLFSMILALVMTAGLAEHRLVAACVLALTAAIVLIQIDNFGVINRSFAEVLVGEPAIRAAYPEIPLTVRAGATFTYGEARDLWRCWRGLGGACDVYSRPVSPGATYLLGEFRALDRLRAL